MKHAAILFVVAMLLIVNTPFAQPLALAEPSTQPASAEPAPCGVPSAWLNSC